ncbi:MAG TPA: proline--tRNA ligase [Actinomycetota bacterium]|nr:proline--tRNA ligase [Actinomycetota bacterium]
MAKGLPKQAEDFPAWYQEVVKQTGMAEHGLARGSQVIKPYGYALWENMQRALDDRFKATGHENLMFPLLIPYHVLAREEEHLEGFSAEVWTVTHGGGNELEEPLAIRPTSEAVIWNAYSNWVQSYRDLPLLYNQWCNVMRYELRTRLFLRTSEFLWQEGHTAHATRDEAWAEALQMLEIYREVAEDVLAVPVLPGRKSEAQRFPGADETFPIEGLMRDKRALQCGTSHFLGQNFAKAYDVTFLNDKGDQEYVWGTSWGWSTRMVGGTVMAHGDDNGLRLPPVIAPVQVVIVPIYKTDEERSDVLATATRVRDGLVAAGVRVKVDDRDQHRPGFKFAEWELKGVPLRLELGPKDVAADQVVRANRVTGTKEPVGTDSAIADIAATLDSIQAALYQDAVDFRTANTHEAATFDELREGVASESGFWVTPWCGDATCEAKVSEETTASIRVLPLEREDPGGPCVVCGKPGVERATWAKAY